MSKNKILALILARGGSKRILGKNKKILNGKPLISWSIEALLRSNLKNILLSTDDKEIAKIAKSYNVIVPWLRPKNLSTDKSSSFSACIHALEWYEKKYGIVDGLLLIQPTSPFRADNTINKGIELFFNNQQKPIVGVTKYKEKLSNLYMLENKNMVPILEDRENTVKSIKNQIYKITGSFYLINPKDLKKYKSFIPKKSIPLEISNDFEAIDIDSEIDWLLAEKICDMIDDLK